MAKNKKDNLILSSPSDFASREIYEKTMAAKQQNIANLQPSFLDNLMKSAVGESLENVFSHLLKEESEKNKQGKTSDKIEKLELRAERDEEEAQDEQEDDEAKGSKAGADTSSPKVKAQKLPSAMEPEDIAKILNIIRAGKSLKDPEVKKRFDIWWDALAPPEKVALKGFLDGIAQIIAGDVEAEEASTPSAGPYNVEMTSAPKEKPRRVMKKGEEKATPDHINAPIIVGEVNDAGDFKKRMIT
jgi:hypothetical protein